MTSTISMSRLLGRKLSDIHFTQLSSEVIEKAKICIFDTLTSVFGGYELPSSQAAVAAVKQFKGDAGTFIWIDGDRVNTADAAFANTALAHSLLQEDTHIISQSHPGSIIIPTALTLGEESAATGKQIIEAIVAGYEAMARVGRYLVTDEFNRRGFRPSGVFGPFGSCIVAARLLNLSEDQTCAAMGLAGNCSAGVMEFASAGTRDFPLHNAFAARNGITSAYLAKYGATAPERILEGKFGVANAYSGASFDTEKFASAVSDDYEIMEVYFKSYPACGFVQTTPRAAMRLAQEFGIRPEDIEEITIGIFTMGKIWPGTDYSGPFDEITQAQMSNQFMAAAALIDGNITPATLHRRKNPQYSEIAKKIKVEIDPECDKNYPPKESVKMTVRTRDGRSFSVFEEDMTLPDNQFVIDRFASYGKDLLSETSISELMDRIQNIEKVKNISEITALLIREGGK